MSPLKWTSVIDRPNVPVEFGASHVRYAWRTHTSPTTKFTSLQSALLTSKHSLLKLLQDVNGNPNANRNTARGEALFAALWYPDSDWAILCDATRATLVRRHQIEAIEVCKVRNDRIIELVRLMFDTSQLELRREFNESLYASNIQHQSASCQT